MSILKLLSLPLVLLLLNCGLSSAKPYALVAGFDSDNVIQFDLETGHWKEIAQLEPDSRPRGIAVSPGGEIFLGLRGAGQNVVKLTPKGGNLVPVPISPRIERFGPGMIAFAPNGDLLVAGDASRVVFRIDSETGDVLDKIRFPGTGNLVGLTVHGNDLYTAEYFQRSVWHFDFSTGQPGRFVRDDSHLDGPLGMTVDANGNLLVANSKHPRVQEFDAATGQFERTLIDLSFAQRDKIKGVSFSKGMDRYFVSSGDSIYEADLDGSVLAIHNSPALEDAYGIAVVSAEDGPSLRLAGTRQIPSLKMMDNRIRITGESGEVYIVEATADFEHWETVAVLENETGSVDFVDSQGSDYDKRFYRFRVRSSSPDK